MKKFKIIAVLLLVGFLFASCATASSVGGVSGPHGLFTGNGAASNVVGTEIASYSVILGIVDSGYADYVTAVKAAEASGKKITSVTKNMIFLVKTTAYAN